MQVFSNPVIFWAILLSEFYRGLRRYTMRDLKDWDKIASGCYEFRWWNA